MTGYFRCFIRENGPFRTLNPDLRPQGFMCLANSLKFNYLGTIHYLIQIGVIKLSLLAFYYRFLSPKPYHRLLYCLGGAIIVGMIGTVFVSLSVLAVNRLGTDN